MVTLSFSTLNTLDMPGAETPDLRVLHPLEDVLHGAADAGFEHVGLDHASLASWLQRGRSVDDLARVLAGEGLRCTDVGVLRIEDATSSVESAARLARLASLVGAPVCTGIVLREPGWTALPTLQRCADILADVDVRIALEFVPYSPVRTLREASVPCSEVGWDRCGLLLDTWMFFNGDNAWEELEALPAHHIAGVQLDDAPEPISRDLVHESRHRRLLPGSGRFDLDRFVRTLTATGYDGLVSLEVLAAEFRALAPAEQARRGLAAMSTFWPSAASASDKEPA